MWSTRRFRDFDRFQNGYRGIYQKTFIDGRNSLAIQSLEAIIGAPGNALELKWAGGEDEPLHPKSRLGYHVAGSDQRYFRAN